MSETIHATSVAIGGRAVLIQGRSGTGKSDLALRLIDRGAILVSDDYTLLRQEDGGLLASAPTTIVGQIEVRGLGILPVASVAQAPVALAVRLGEKVDRMPDADLRCTIAGVRIPQIMLDGFEASAPIKVELALQRVTE